MQTKNPQWDDLPTCIVCCATVVGGREQSDEMALSKTLKSVHHTLMRSYNHLQVVVLQHNPESP